MTCGVLLGGENPVLAGWREASQGQFLEWNTRDGVRGVTGVESDAADDELGIKSRKFETRIAIPEIKLLISAMPLDASRLGFAIRGKAVPDAEVVKPFISSSTFM